MLRALHIGNFALIDTLNVEFGAGLNILTGETGAGKSIIIDALGFVLGDRVVAADVVRTGTDKALVEAVFDIDGAGLVADKLSELGIECEDGTLFLSRELSGSSGKSQGRVNGRLTPVATLKDIGDTLVDVHGQHDHQSLLFSDRHGDVFDEWCGQTVIDLKARLSEGVRELGRLRRDLDQLRRDDRERARLLDLYRYQIDEIDVANLKAGEDAELYAERLRLANAAKLSATSAEAYDLLSGGERTRGAADLLNAALSQVTTAASMDDRLDSVVDCLREAASYAEDASRALRQYRDDVEYSPERLEQIDNRLDLIKGLKRKYGETMDQVLAHAAELTQSLDNLENLETRKVELEKTVGNTEEYVEGIAAKLTAARKRESAGFVRSIVGELADLGMGATQFEVSLAPQEITSSGAERVEFLISPNPGEPLKPLARIASGGEMSRVMLAIKSVITGSVGVPTVIFDEVDAGVGGRTANILGDKLAALASKTQILCVTHLPQIAARGSTHLLIEKNSEGGRTSVKVDQLRVDDRVHEIVRMLGGAPQAEAVVRHAREMLGIRN